MNTLSKRHAGNLPVAQTLPAIPWFRPFCGMILLALLILMANKGLSQTVFNYTGTIQTYTVPPGITSISIEAKGAQGGGEFGGGKGAIIRATFPVTGGQVLKILVGENPVFQNDEFNITSFNRYNQGGGGGSFVWNDTSGTLMIAAGGGGGDNYNIFNGSSNGLDASLSPSGTNGNGIIYYGVGGQSGMGGQIGSVGPAGKGYGAGGAGWLTNGANASSFGCATPTGGLTPLNGGAGGTWSPGQFVFLSGGFGGGGGPQRVTTSLVNSTTSCNSGGGGGGGGYSGGGGGSHDIGFGDNGGGGGGGGSYSIGSGTNGSVGNTGHGQITIFSEPAGALNFDGANDFIHVPNGMNLSATSFTIEFWAKKGNNNVGQNVIFNQGNQGADNRALHIGFRSGATGNFMFDFWNSALEVPGLTDNNWHHWACTYDKSNSKRTIYRDGVIVGTNTGVFIGSGTSSFRIGNFEVFGSQFYSGNLDELRVWSRVVPQCEIVNNMNCELTGPQTGLAAYYKFNQGIGNGSNGGINTLADHSGNNRTGPLFGFGLSGGTSNWVSGIVTNSCSPFAPLAVSINSNSPVYTGNTLDLSATATGSGAGAATYTWTGPNSFSSALQNPSISNVSSVTAGEYKVTAVANGCTAGNKTSTKILQGPANVHNGILTWLDASDVFANGGNNPANGTSISTWVDKSNNSHPATIMPGMTPAVYFSTGMNGSPDLRILKTGVSTGSIYQVAGVDIRAVSNPEVTIFTVYRQYPHGSNELQGLWGNDNGNWDRFFLTSSWNNNINDGAASLGPQATPVAVVPGAGVTGQVRLMTAVYDHQAPNGSAIYFNGQTVTTFTDQTDISDAQANLRIGWDGDNNSFNGEIAEMIVYDRVLSYCEIQDINNYLGSKYGVLFTTASISAGGPTTFCHGSSVNLTASAGTSYQWLYNGSPLSGATSNTYSAHTSGSYRVVVSSGGCPDTSLATVVTVLLPPKKHTVTGGGDYCPSGTKVPVGLSNSEMNVNYVLYRNGVLIESKPGTGSPISFSLQVTAGTYTVIATSTINGCSDTMNGSATVVVNPLPIAFNVTGGGDYCQGGTGVPVGLSGSETGVNYQLKFGPSIISSVAGTGSAISFGNQLSAGSYIVIATNTVTNCITTMSGNVQITVNPLPTAFLLIGGGGYCTGGTGVQIFLLGSQVGVSYQLKNGSSSVGGLVAGTGNGINFGNQTPGTYTVVAINDNTGCTANMNGSRTIIINPLPVAFSVSGGGSYCAGGAGVPIGLSNSEINVGYGLYRNGVNVASMPGTGSAVSFPLQTIAGTYTVDAKNASGCKDTMNGSATVVVDPLPAVVTLSGGGSYCADGGGQPINLNTTETGIRYDLYLDGNKIAAAFGSDSFMSYGNQTAAGTYTAIAVNQNTGCTNNVAGSVIISTNSLPVATIAAGGVTSVCPGSTVMLVATAVAGSGAIGSYQWLNNGNIIPAANGSTFGATSTGNYSVKVVNTNNCSEVSNTVAVTVSDNMAPVIACPASITVNCDDFTTTEATGVATATDNCSIASVTHNDVSTQDADVNNAGHYNYTITRTWTALDVHDNSSSCVQTIMVQDVTAPVVSCPSNTTVSCDASIATTATGIATGSDNCSGATITHSDASTQHADANNAAHYNYAIARTWTATDVSGNSSTCVQTITVQDQAAPAITCLSNVTVSCDASIAPSATGITTSSDNCSPVTITYADNNSENANVNDSGHYNYIITRTWTATDVSGNVSSCSQIISVQDVTAPSITVPSNTIVNCQDDYSPAANGSASGTDNCSPVAISYTDTNTQDANANNAGQYNYTITRTWKAADVSGNFTTDVQTITVQDITAPVITCPSNTTVSCNASTAILANGTATGTDNCSGVTISHSDASTQDANANNEGHYNYTITRTWKATDVTGNFITCVQTIAVQDVTAPTVSCPANTTVSCDASIAVAANGEATGSDNCSGVTITHSDASTQHADANNAGHYNYAIIRTWTATDVTGNFTACAQTITVQDVTAPSITCPSNTTLSCDASTAVADNGIATATDNCNSPVVITHNDVSTQSANVNDLAHYIYTITRTWAATDIAGNSSSCAQIIAVQDVTAPVVAFPSNTTVNAGASIAPSATGSATGTDNCAGPVVITHSDVSTQSANMNDAAHYNYTITRTWTATDVAGNVKSDIQTITVQDVTAPVITCPSNATVSCDASTAASANGEATGTDSNNSPVAITRSDASTQDANANNAGHYNYTITRTWTATDVTGNFTTCAQTITVQDITAPAITCPSNTTVSCDASTAVTANGTATGTDNCSGVTITHSDVSTQDANANNAGHYNYSITRTWTATDVTGNATSCTQTITVRDVTAPVITCPSNTTVSCDASTAVAANGEATGTDNCSGVTITHSDVSTQDANANNAGHYNYMITRTWTATDVTGNFTTCAQTITVQDVTAPVITCSSNTTVSCDASTAVAANGTATGTDNCSGVTITHSDVSTQDVDANNAGHYNYTITRTWTATDVTGNASSCTQTITVQDATAPVIACPSNTTVSCDGSTSVSANGAATATDNCSGVTITHSDVSTLSANVNDAAHYNYTITRTWTATDVTGNATSCTQTITVQDVTAPVVTCPSNTTVSCDASTAVAANGTATGTDNCSPVAITHSDVSTQDAYANNAGHYSYTITRTWTATDVTGNFTTCAQTITVQDITAPAITCPSNATVSCDASTAVAANGTATGTDNCSGVTIMHSDVSTQSANVNSAAHYNYTITRTWTATDVTGNFTTCTQTITVQDVTAPSITCPADATVSCKTSVTDNGSATGSDNCSLVAITHSDASTQDPNTANTGHYNYTITRTWKATDVTDNFTTCNQVITVRALNNAAIVISPVNTINSNHQNHTIYLGYGPQSVTLAATANDGVGAYNYNWSPTAGVANPASATTSVSPQVTTTYTVTITDGTGCSITQSFTVNVIDVRCGNKIKICHYPPGNTSNPQQLCLPASAIPAHLAHGCVLGDCPQSKDGNSTDEEHYDDHMNGLVVNEVKVYPNPNNGVFTVELPAGMGNANVVITDMAGKVIQKKPAMQGNKLEFDLGGVARGLYMVHVISGNETYRSKINVQ